VSDDPRFDSSRESEPTGLSRHLNVFLEDRALWPLLIIFVVHVALAGALVMLSALRAGSLLACAALAILAMLSVDAIRRARRRRRATIWILTLWALSALTAGVSSYLGLL
jgi:hypothetical protein